MDALRFAPKYLMRSNEFSCFSKFDFQSSLTGELMRQ